MPRLRLSHKLLAAFALPLVVVIAVVGWHLLATSRLAAENRTIVQHAVPAVRLEVTLLDAFSSLRRLEARYTLLQGGAYLEVFQERSRSMETDLSYLGFLLSTDGEREALAEARARLDEYREAMSAGSTRSADREAGRLEAALRLLYDRSDVELRRRQAAAQTLSERSQLVATAGLAACALVGAAIFLFAALRIGRPLRKLEAATRQVAEGNFSEPIPVHGGDEVAELTRAFNQMAARLKELDTLKEEFFSAVSHDFRTPLTAIGWSAELLGSDEALTPRQKRLTDGVLASCRRLLALVNQIVDLGQLKAGRILLDLRFTDLRQVVEACAAEIRPLAEQGELKLDVMIGEGLPAVVCDPERLQQVLVNLLGNAVKFTKPGGRVWLTAERAGTNVVIKVSDTGIGIPRHLLPTVFERYQQAHGGRGGSGIGLAVVKGIVEAHGGRVWAESEEGHGSTFVVMLRLEPGRG